MHNAFKNRISELKKRVNEQCRILGSLAESLEGEDRLRQLIKRVEGQCEALSSLAGGSDFSGEGFVLSWPETRSLFLEYLEFKRYEPANARNMLNYLDRFVKKPITAPMDVMKMFSPLTSARICTNNLDLKVYCTADD